LAGFGEEDLIDQIAVQDYPFEFTLDDNYPNPFNAQTTIEFNLHDDCDVRLDVYNLKGQRVDMIVDGRLSAGQHTVIWDASQYASGFYFYKLIAGDNVFTKRMMLLK